MGIYELIAAVVLFWLSWGTDIFWAPSQIQNANEHPDEWHFPRWFVRFHRTQGGARR